MKKILIADDDAGIRSSLSFLLTTEGFTPLTATTPGEIISILEKESVDAVLLDLNYQKDTTSGMEGLNLISKIVKINGNLPIIVMTGWATVTVAVEAMRRGAKDFIEKPWHNERLISILNTQIRLLKTEQQNKQLKQKNSSLKLTLSELSNSEAGDIMGLKSLVMRELMKKIKQIALANINILLTGENGTGKSLLAYTIHQQSERREQPFVSVNLGAIPENLFESELFGHTKGAFTGAHKDRIGRFELAEKGSLFLDEVGNLTLSQQAKLLRVLEEKCYEPVGSSITQKADIRLIAATNANLLEEVKSQTFREDLYYRINTVSLRVPSLREREEDIPELAHFFLKQFSSKHKRDVQKIDEKAVQTLVSYPWPGNVRELSHTIERAVLFTTGNTIERNNLGLTISPSESTVGNPDIFDIPLEEAEKILISHALKKAKGNAKQAQKTLGLSKSSFYRRLEKFGL